MLENIKGIVLKTVKFSDTKLIVDLFTLSHGRQSFVTSMSHSKQGRSQMAFWQPLSLVEFQADIRPNASSLPKPKDVRLYSVYTDIPYNPLKSTIALFLAEFVNATLRNESVNTPLYYYMENSFLYLDNIANSASIANFHLVFLLRLTRFVGILPNLDIPSPAPYMAVPLFDLVSSNYTFSVPTHHHYLQREEAALLPLLFRLDYSTMHLLRLSRSQRSRFLQLIEEYYRLHVPAFPEIKSIGILQEIFS